MHLADLTSYVQAHEQLGELYPDPDAWARKAILNVAGSGKFSSDRTIAEYASDIWKVKPCPVPLKTTSGPRASRRWRASPRRERC